MKFFKTTICSGCLAFACLHVAAQTNSSKTLLDATSAIPSDGQSGAPLASPVSLPWEKVLPGAITNYQMLLFTGGHNNEFRLQKIKLSESGYKFAEDAGRSSRHFHPCWMLSNTKTDRGIAVSLAYSGNWKIEIKPDGDNTRIRITTSPEDVQQFDTIGGIPLPGALVAEFTGDWDYGAQPIVRYIRKNLVRNNGENWPPVVFNTWFAVKDKVDEDTVLKAIPVAAKLGCELFAVDAGWYGGESLDVKDWYLSLGDWSVNREKFPSGLKSISKKVHEAGMKFGLWVEIECASTSSPIGKAHPDWFLRHEGKLISKRSVLDFGNPEVLAWAKSVADRLITEYDLDYFKNDYNNNMVFDVESVKAANDPESRHLRGLMELLQYLHKKYPKLIFENCSSGSQRLDVMSAALSDTAYLSDRVGVNVWDLIIPYGATYLFPPETCMHWTTPRINNDPTLDLESQFTVNMMGHFGISCPIWEWDASKLEVAAERIALYKQIRPVLRKSVVYHLTRQANPYQPVRAMHAALYVDDADDEALLFAFQAGDPRIKHHLRLCGLRPESSYRLIMPKGYESPPRGRGVN